MPALLHLAKGSGGGKGACRVNPWPKRSCNEIHYERIQREGPISERRAPTLTPRMTSGDVTSNLNGLGEEMFVTDDPSQTWVDEGCLDYDP